MTVLGSSAAGARPGRWTRGGGRTAQFPAGGVGELDWQPQAITTGLLVHWENSFNGPYASTMLPTRTVANVFIRNSGTFEPD